MRKALQELGTYKGVWKEVPACRWCNSQLGALALLTIPERRYYIKVTLQRKFKHLLNAKIWSDREIEAMGGGLRGYLHEAKEKVLEIRARLAWAGQNVHEFYASKITLTQHGCWNESYRSIARGYENR